ncbi:hypothetical protein HPULCUR_005056 [Helicostylum pulchrum]|uniref:Uncharacterized protein n=1 Tax=Helicostylum pulchrum TaxID=562976 RepID=A0ABP9XZA3_9FUNG
MIDEINEKWFYIQQKLTGMVIATSSCETHARSQAVVVKPQYTDNELWCWDNHHLKNKFTGLVLDIRKGRLRLIEDTEICLYYKKPQPEAHNQLWATRAITTVSEHPLYKETQASTGLVVYSLSNRDWVLDAITPEDNLTEDLQKLVLIPYQEVTKSQIWNLIYQVDMNVNQEPSLIFEDSSINSSIIDDGSTSGQVSPVSIISCDSMEFPHGLSPSKRNSQTSLTNNSRKTSLEDIYLYQPQNICP